MEAVGPISYFGSHRFGLPSFIGFGLNRFTMGSFDTFVLQVILRLTLMIRVLMEEMLILGGMKLFLYFGAEIML